MELLERLSELKPEDTVFDDYIISLIDGKPYKMLRRHLAKHGFTPQQYKQKYDLPPNYPLTAKNYSEKRTMLSKKFDLGHTPKKKPIPKDYFMDYDGVVKHQITLAPLEK